MGLLTCLAIFRLLKEHLHRNKQALYPSSLGQAGLGRLLYSRCSAIRRKISIGFTVFDYVPHRCSWAIDRNFISTCNKEAMVKTAMLWDSLAFEDFFVLFFLSFLVLASMSLAAPGRLHVFFLMTPAVQWWARLNIKYD